MKPRHIIIYNELAKLLRSGRITKVTIVSVDGEKIVWNKPNKLKGEKK